MRQLLLSFITKQLSNIIKVFFYEFANLTKIFTKFSIYFVTNLICKFTQVEKGRIK